MVNINATSAILCGPAAAPGMKLRRWGRIINVASVPGVDRTAPNMSASSASKAAVVNLTESLAEELRPFGIVVSAVVPTVIDTEASRPTMLAADHRK